MKATNSASIAALIYYEKGLRLSVDNEVFITVIAPAAGIIIGASFEGIAYYLKKRRRNKVDSPQIIPVTVNSNGNNPNWLRRTVNRVKRTLPGRSVRVIYEKLASSRSLRIVISSSANLVDGIIIVRAGILTKDILKHYIHTRENLFRVVYNTLCWIVYSKEREIIVNAAFLIVTLISAKLWTTKNYVAQRTLRVWVFITLFNLSSYIYVHTDVLDHRPSDIGVFGFPRVEHPIKQLNLLTENLKNSNINILGKEETVLLSAPVQNEISKGVSNNVELEINKIIQNSTLGEETIVLSKKEGLQKGKARKTNFTSKRRTNSLQKLNQTYENVKSLPIENDPETLTNLTKIKSEKVQ